MQPSISEVKKRHEARLLALPGVVSVGIGRDADGNPAIVVGLSSPHPHIQAQLPQYLEGYRVLTQIIGSLRAQ